MALADPPYRIELLDLDRPIPKHASFHRVLSPGEADRARAYRRPRDRDRFIARRGWLRTMLAQTVGGAPEMLRFAANAFGKPYLPDHPTIRFNTSHSGGVALLAVAHRRDIGCDIERCDPANASPEVADRHFSPSERAALAMLAGDAWTEGFFNCWTRKEAYVKALGRGLSHPLQAFSVSLAPEEAARFVESTPGWELSAPNVIEGFRAAIVVARDIA